MERFDLREGKQLGFEDMAVLMGKPAGKKYESSYEQIAKAITLFCGDEARMDSLSRLFEYVAISVMTRNGDAHLKNFGLLYESPASEQGPMLSPLYDVVTTSAYDLVNPRTQAKMVDRRLALNLNKSKDYPNRQQLHEFGRNICFVKQPEQVIERIGDAMQKTLQQHGSRAEAAFLKRMKREWDDGRLSLERSRFLTGGVVPAQSNKATVRDAETQAGRYADQVIAVDAHHVFQNIGKGEQIKHDRAVFGAIVPQVGQMLKIRYQQGQVARLVIDGEEKTQGKNGVER